MGALDFGTTFSGWAYSFKHDFEADPTRAFVHNWIAESAMLVTEKTPTCALIAPDGETLVAFGYDAENKYKVLAETGDHRDHYYFRRFKMALNHEVCISIHWEVSMFKVKLTIIICRYWFTIIICRYWFTIIICRYWFTIIICRYWFTIIICRYWFTIIICRYWFTIIICRYWFTESIFHLFCHKAHNLECKRLSMYQR